MARRYALIVGVGDYSHDLTRLPNSVRDAEMVSAVMRGPAGFDDVKTMVDPELHRLAEAVELLFSERQPDDLVLFYFSGHGVKDDRGLLHFAVPETRRHASGALLRSSAMPARHVHDAMANSRSRRQVVILDCCFSGAFADGVHAKDGGRVDLREELGGEGRAVLASSSAMQYSFDAESSGLSTYTQFLVHGIATGEADLNHDGVITADELHEYARHHVQSIRPAMSPQILPSREGYSIVISKAKRVDPRLAYAAKVREIADMSGAIPVMAAQVLGIQRQQLGISEAEAQRLETEALAPIRTRAANRAQLRRAVFTARRRRRVQLDRPLLNELRVSLGLSEVDLRSLLEEPIKEQRRKVRGWLYWPEQMAFVSLALLGLTVVVKIGLPIWQARQDQPAATTPKPDGSLADLFSTRASSRAATTREVAAPRKDISWWCICYVRNDGQSVTACRESPGDCESLRQAIHRGSREIRAQSATTGCEAVRGEHPGDAYADRASWSPSQKAGAWVNTRGCLLRR